MDDFAKEQVVCAQLISKGLLLEDEDHFELTPAGTERAQKLWSAIPDEDRMLLSVFAIASTVEELEQWDESQT